MKTLLIVNTVALAIAVVAIISLLLLWVRAEKKLSRHGESSLDFIKKGDYRK